MYLNSTSFLPRMMPFANTSRKNADDPKYNKLLHSDYSSRVLLNHLKSTYAEFKSSHSKFLFFLCLCLLTLTSQTLIF